MKDETIDTIGSEDVVVIELRLKFITMKDLIWEDPTKNVVSGHCYPSNVNARIYDLHFESVKIYDLLSYLSSYLVLTWLWQNVMQSMSHGI